MTKQVNLPDFGAYSFIAYNMPEKHVAGMRETLADDERSLVLKREAIEHAERRFRRERFALVFGLAQRRGAP